MCQEYGIVRSCTGWVAAACVVKLGFDPLLCLYLLHSSSLLAQLTVITIVDWPHSFFLFFLEKKNILDFKKSKGANLIN